MIKVSFRENLFILVELAIGAVGGFLYWKYVGCTGSTCPITSLLVNSTPWRAVMGGLLLNLFKTGSTPKGTD